MLLLGTLSVLFLVVALIGLLLIWGVDISKSFSQLAARKKSSTIYYFFTFAMFLLLFSRFMLSWLIPEGNLPLFFTLIFVIGVLGQLVAVIVPETGGLNTKIHIAAAGLMTASVTLQAVIFTFAQNAPTALQAFGIATLIMMIAIWGVLLIKSSVLKYSLVLQSAYFASYLMLVLLFAYSL
jgi:hypothetical protein